MTEYNLYCDESCHLEHDDSDVMVLGALIIPKDKRQEITENILQIKARYGVKARTEVKWTKASMPKIDLYKDLLNCFFLDDDILLYLVVFRFGLTECLEIGKRWYFNAFAILQVVTGYDCMERNVTVFVCGLYAE